MCNDDAFFRAATPSKFRYFVYICTLFFSGEAISPIEGLFMFVIVPSEKPVDFQRVSFVLFTFFECEHVENERNSLFSRQFAAQKRGLVFGKGLILRQKRNRNG